MSAKDEKRNGYERPRTKAEALNLKLDRRILAALRRESAARGGHQEERITEEALIAYLGLKALSQTNGFAAFPETAARTTSSYKYSRIVE
jgi:hypothetical protein